MEAWYVRGDSAGLKSWFSVAAKLRLASLGHPGGESLETGGFLLYALLSDNEEVIQAAARATNKLMHDASVNPLYPRYKVHMIQLAILGDDQRLEAKLEKLAKHGENPERKEAASGNHFYSLLLRRDKAGLERLIQHKHAKIKSADVLFEDCMSYLGTLETKLCWRRGIEVQIDSPLVPMDLMPVRPLEQYDDVYEFLKPGWVPTRQGLLARMAGWFGGGR